MRLRECILLSASAMVCTVPVSALFAQSIDPATEAAKARQDALKSVVVDFTVKEDIAPGGISEGRPKIPGLSSVSAVPSVATTIESKNRVIFSGSHLRYENNHPVFHGETGKLLQLRLINVCNGSFDKQLYTVGESAEAAPQGVIARNPRSMDIKSADLLPLTMMLRGLEHNITPQLVSSLKPTGKHLPIGGAPCSEYSSPSQSARVTSFWLVPSNNYVVRRIRREEHGKLLEQFDIEYRFQELGEIPGSWVRNRYTADGKVRVSTRVDVVSARVGEPQPEELFDITFPPGAKVFDARTSKDYRVKEDGTMREVSRMTGQEMPGAVYQPGTTWLRRNLWSLITAVALTAVVLMLYGLYRRSHRTKSRSQ